MQFCVTAKISCNSPVVNKYTRVKRQVPKIEKDTPISFLVNSIHVSCWMSTSLGLSV